MAEVRTYDASNVTVTVKGQFITGFAEGSFVECEKDETNFDVKVSAQGDVSVAKRNNTLGTITITLSQTSPSVNFLDSLANSGEIFPVSVISNNEVKEKVYGTKAMVEKPANKTFSDEVEDREFTIKVFDYTVE
jgi:UTP-glucose-1-phosphate uridylyltransferase